MKGWLVSLVHGMREMRYTDWTWVVVGIELLIVEAIALGRGDPPLTTSMRLGADRWLLWPALVGCLCGHFFGTRLVSSSVAPLALVVIGAAVLYRDLFVRTATPPATHMALFLALLGLGAALWGSRA